MKIRNFVKESVVFLYKKLIKPKSESEDLARREFILNIFLLSTLVLISVATAAVTYNSISEGSRYQGNSPLYVLTIFLSFAGLLLLSRKGFSLVTAHIFICIFLLIILYGLYLYGVDQPQSLLGLAMLIVMTGVLINSKFAFLTMALSSLFIIFVGYAQFHHWYTIKGFWREELPSLENPIIISIILGILAIISWLSNREIEKSLTRARRSEADLKKERDSLEITVEARTRELKETQAEKMIQLYRFAEFGRLSSSLFHDLINPLTAVSLNIEKVKNVGETKQYVDKAIVAAKKMENMVSAVRKQLARPAFAEASADKQENKINFSLKEEIEGVISVLSHKAQKAGVTIQLLADKDINLFGDAVKFNQVALNLVCNAIDAYLPAAVLAKDGQEKGDNDTRKVTISLSQNRDMITFEVKDRGIGISEENKPRLFEPFFTTKAEAGGIGIGLSMTKRIVEKDFGGNIEVASKEGDGSVFTVKFPQKDNG